MLSPVSTWYIREVVASEKSASYTASSRARSVALNLMRGGYGIDTALWVDRQVQISREAADKIQRGLCADILAVDWKTSENPYAPNSELGSISKWVDAVAERNNSDLQGTDRFGAYYLSGVQLATQRDSLIGLSVVSVKADFTNHLAGLGPRDLPYYADGQLRGIRVDAKDGHTSLYIMFSDSQHLTALRQTLNANTWKLLRTKFIETSVDIRDAMWKRQFSGRFDAGAERLFGAVLPEGGFLEQGSTFSLDDGILNISTISSLLGVMPPPGRGGPGSNETRILANAILHFMKPRLVVIEDRDTGAILFIGYYP